jgi:argininosuccinate lyase
MSKSIYKNAYTTWERIIKIYTHIINELEFNEEILESSITPDLLLTDQVYKLVKTGVPFRDAYQRVKEDFFSKL